MSWGFDPFDAFFPSRNGAAQRQHAYPQTAFFSASPLFSMLGSDPFGFGGVPMFGYASSDFFGGARAYQSPPQFGVLPDHPRVHTFEDMNRNYRESYSATPLYEEPDETEPTPPSESLQWCPHCNRGFLTPTALVAHAEHCVVEPPDDAQYYNDPNTSASGEHVLSAVEIEETSVEYITVWLGHKETRPSRVEEA
ncbi:hypothetical protein Pelo_4666 [Pelomyxa schiedti]|nr:hypothetical protein Pelo_4666 [Pelomyxa schiedti]